MSKADLISKLKNVIHRSGFPLELKIGSILERNKWSYTISNLYEDFETGKLREADIVAQKRINQIEVQLFIECKKSEDKQVLLYSPKHQEVGPLWNSSLKIFPKLTFGKNLSDSPFKIYNELGNLMLFNNEIPTAKSLIVTKGEVVTQDNIAFLSAINGIIKKSIHVASNGHTRTGHRYLFLYVLIFDGSLLQLTSSKTEDFDLKEISYGKYTYKHLFQFAPEYQLNKNHVMSTTVEFGEEFLIELMNPEKFDEYIQNLDLAMNKVNHENIKSWGVDFPSLKKIKFKLDRILNNPQTKDGSTSD